MLFSFREDCSLLCKVSRVGAFHFIWSETGLSQGWVAVFWGFVLLLSSGSPFLLKCSSKMPSAESLVYLHVPLPGASCTPILINRFVALCPSQSQSLLNVLKGQQLNVSFSFPPLPSHPDFGPSGLQFWLFGSLTWWLKTPLISLHSAGIGPQGLSHVTESGMCRRSRGIDTSRMSAHFLLLSPLRTWHSGLCHIRSSLLLYRDVCCVVFVYSLLFFLAGAYICL